MQTKGINEPENCQNVNVILIRILFDEGKNIEKNLNENFIQ